MEVTLRRWLASAFGRDESRMILGGLDYAEAPLLHSVDIFRSATPASCLQALASETESRQPGVPPESGALPSSPWVPSTWPATGLRDVEDSRAA